MTTLTDHQRKLLQAILDGKTIVGVVSREPYSAQDLLAAVARQPTSLAIKPSPVHRFIPVLKMPAGSIYMAEGKIDFASAVNPDFNGMKTSCDKLAGVLYVELEPDTMRLVKAEMVKS
jgi:hypothetical protein